MNRLEETLRAVRTQKEVVKKKASKAKNEEEYDHWMNDVKMLDKEEIDLLKQLGVKK